MTVFIVCPSQRTFLTECTIILEQVFVISFKRVQFCSLIELKQAMKEKAINAWQKVLGMSGLTLNYLNFPSRC